MQEFVFFDYFTFTIRLEKMEEIFEILGVEQEIFTFQDKATNHYVGSFDFENVLRIKFAEMSPKSLEKYEINLNRAFEVNVTMTGRIVREFSLISSFDSCFSMLNSMRKNKLLLAPINFTRVDFTKDDKEGLLDLEVLERKISKKQIVTRLSVNIIKSMKEKETNKFLGKTIYFGSKDSNSDFFIRIYNKSSEKFAKKMVSKEVLNEHHTRVEMVFKGAKQANPLMKKVFEYYDEQKVLGELFSGVLVSKLKILKNGKEPAKKLEENLKNMCPKYKRFLDTMKKINLGVESPSTSIEQKINFVQSLDKMMSMISQSMGEENLLEMIKEMTKKGDKKISILEREEIENYKKRNRFIESEKVSEEK